MAQLSEKNYAIIASLHGECVKLIQQSLNTGEPSCWMSGIDEFQISERKVPSSKIALYMMILMGNDREIKMFQKREKGITSKLKMNDGCACVNKNPVKFSLGSRYREVAKLLPNLKSQNLIKLLFQLKTNSVFSPILTVQKDQLQVILEVLSNKFALHLLPLSLKPVIKFDGILYPSHQCEKVEANDRTSTTKILQIAESDRSTATSVKTSNTLLHSAVNSGQINVVKDLIETGIDVNVVDENGNKAIHYAVKRNDVQLTKLLLSHGTKVKSHCVSLIFVAAVNRSSEILDLLLQHNAVVDSRNKTGSTALHVAATCGDEKIAKLVLDKGLDVNVTTNDGITPLHLAVQNEKTKMVKLLLHYGADVNVRTRNGSTPFRIAVGKGHSNIVEELVKNFPDEGEKDIQAFYSAIRRCGSHYRKTVEVLLSHGFKLNDQDINNFELLDASIENGYTPIIYDVLERGANANVSDWSAFRKNYTLLHSAAKNSRLEIARLLIKYGGQVNSLDGNKKKPLCYAVETNDFQMSKLLIKSGTNLTDDCFAFLTAVKKGNLNIIQELLKYDVNVDSQDEFGTTALHFAAWNGDEEVVTLLLAKGIHMVTETNRKAVLQATSTPKIKRFINILGYTDQDFRKEMCTTPLHIAVRRNHKNIVLILLENGVDVNARDGTGKTALHVACRMRLLDITEALLEYGADVSAQDESGNSALYYLQSNVTCMRYYDIRGYDRVRCVCDQAFECTYELDFKCESELSSTFLVEVLVKHIARITFDKNISEEVSNLINRCEKSGTFYQNCLSELKTMKESKISNISFFDWLTKNVNTLSVYARNKDLFETFKASEYKREFSIYGKMLGKNFDKAEERLRLMDSAVRMFMHPLPCLVVEEIMQYLNVMDLRNLIASCDSNIKNCSLSGKNVISESRNPVINEYLILGYN